MRAVAKRSAGIKGNEVGEAPAAGAKRRITDQVSAKWKAKGASMTREPRPMAKRSQDRLRGGFDRGIGRAPVPGGESEEKKCGREWVGAPQEQIGGGKR